MYQLSESDSKMGGVCEPVSCTESDSGHSTFSSSSLGASAACPEPQPQPCDCPPSDLKSRNAFLHYLQYYRRKYACESQPMSEVTVEAARRWNRMSLNDKCCFIQAARKCSYVYRPRDRDFRKMLDMLRNSLRDEEQVDTEQLKKLVDGMEQWKERTLNNILEDN